MEEISNKTLATLLVVAIVISLAGTFFAMRGVSSVTNVISGAATSTSGEAAVNITQQLSIILRNTSVYFGSGLLYSNSTQCDLDSSLGAAYYDTSCWNATVPNTPEPFLLENDGNVVADITITSVTAATLFTGSTAGSPAYKASVAEPGGRITGCDGTPQTALDLTASAQSLCTSMNDSNLADQIEVDILMTVPTVAGGNKSAIVTFDATVA